MLPGNLTDRTFPDLDRLARAAELLETLAAHPGWSLLMDLIDAERQSVLRGLQSGIKEQAEYAHAHGRVAGLETPAGIVQAVVTRAAERLAEAEADTTGAERP
jgi:hypothetical protein